MGCMDAGFQNSKSVFFYTKKKTLKTALIILENLLGEKNETTFLKMKMQLLASVISVQYIFYIYKCKLIAIHNGSTCMIK